MAVSLHECEKRKCAGIKYCGLKLKCYNCRAFTFLECIEKSSSIKFLLQSLEITEYDGTSDKQLYIEQLNTKFNKMFSDAMIQFMCNNCIVNGVRRDTVNPSDNDPIDDILLNNPNINNTRGGRGKSHLSANAAPFAGTNVNDKTNENDQEKSKKPLNVKKNVGFYEIYIAKFEKKTTLENIIQRICDSIDSINDNMFNVQKLGGARKHHTFASFKVSTVSYRVCCDILNMDWGSQKAEIFSNGDLSLPRRIENNSNNAHRPPIGASYRKSKNRPPSDNRPYEYHHNNNNRRGYGQRDNRNFRGRNDSNGFRNQNRDHRENIRFRNQYRDNRDRRFRTDYRVHSNRNDVRYQRGVDQNVLDDFLETLRRTFDQRNYNRPRYNQHR